MGSKNYDDQVDMYLAGEYRTILFTDAQIKENTAHRLVLEPQKK